MAQTITQIDYLIHPFFHYSLVGITRAYPDERVADLLAVWKTHVDEISADKSRLLFYAAANCGTEIQKRAAKELKAYAQEKLGKRFVEAEAITAGHIMVADWKNNKMVELAEWFKKNKFLINSHTVKTRGLGEFTNACVTTYLGILNETLGLRKKEPFRNPQSTVLWKKSVPGPKSREHPLPWELSLLRERISKGDKTAKIELVGWMGKLAHERITKNLPPSEWTTANRSKKRRSC